MRTASAALVGMAILLPGCASGSADSTRMLSGDTFDGELGLTLVVDDVQVGADETRVPVTIRNTGGYTLVLDPYSSALIVDGTSQHVDRAEFPNLLPYAKGGGGEASGVLVFRDVDPEATRYELQVKGTSENETLGDDGDVEWVAVLQPAADE